MDDHRSLFSQLVLLNWLNSIISATIKMELPGLLVYIETTTEGSMYFVIHTGTETLFVKDFYLLQITTSKHTIINKARIAR